jgi:hypothetical protein
MTYNNYLPDEERYDDSKLKGIYRVSFEIQVESEDDLSISDVAQALTEGFGEKLVDKVAELSVEKITKKSVKVPKILKIGDMVLIKNKIQLKANIYSDDGYFFIGKGSDISDLIAKDVEINIEAGSTGYVNKISGVEVEVANLDRPLTNLYQGGDGLDAINVDLITVNANQIEKIESEEVK